MESLPVRAGLAMVGLDVPGPWYTKISDLWLSVNSLALRRVHAIDAILVKYGPVVRLGPNKIGFIDPEAKKIVYSRYPKDPYCNVFRVEGVETTFTTLDPVVYVPRRRAVAAHYNPANLARFHADAEEYNMRLLSRLDELAGTQAVDTIQMLRHLFVDVVMLVAYGLRTNNVDVWASGKINPVSVAVGDWLRRGLILAYCPRPIVYLLNRYGGPRIRQSFVADQVLLQVADQTLKSAREALAAGLEDEAFPSLPVRLLKNWPINDPASTEKEIRVELVGHTVGGVDTTATTISYILWALAMHPESMRKLQAELDKAMDDPRRALGMDVLTELPYLNAVINEGLRLYESAATLPRVVPDTGAPLSIQGYQIPAGTTVITQGWSAHRQEDMFPNPHKWLPERWLDPTEAMKEAFMPFGTGSRICLGSNLAFMNIRIVLPLLLRNFDIVAPPHTTADSLRVLESFVIFPRSLKCDLLFVPRSR